RDAVDVRYAAGAHRGAASPRVAVSVSDGESVIHSVPDGVGDAESVVHSVPERLRFTEAVTDAGGARDARGRQGVHSVEDTGCGENGIPGPREAGACRGGAARTELRDARYPRSGGHRSILPLSARSW